MFHWLLYSLLTTVAVYKFAAAVWASLTAYRYRKAHELHLAQSLNQTDKILGLSLFRSMQQNARDGVSLQQHYESTQQHGPTISAVLMGKSFISTSEPENIKAVLATQFQCFNLGERNDAFAPFLGRGIFTVDGLDWERSRVGFPLSLKSSECILTA